MLLFSSLWGPSEAPDLDSEDFFVKRGRFVQFLLFQRNICGFGGVEVRTELKLKVKWLGSGSFQQGSTVNKVTLWGLSSQIQLLKKFRLFLGEVSSLPK